MGLENRASGMIYLKIADGKLRTKAKANEDKAEFRRVEVQGKVYEMWEHVFTEVTGMIDNIEIKPHETYGDSALITIRDGDEVYGLTLPEKSGNFRSLCYLLPNIDFSSEVTIKPYAMQVEGKDYKNTGITIYQNGEKVLNYYKDWDEETKTSTLKNGLEEFDFQAVKGNKSKTKILQIQVLEFLTESLKKQIDRFDKEKAEFISSLADKVIAEEKKLEVEDEDLPF